MTLILVMDNDNAIGYGGGLLCRLPEDMKRFRAVTQGAAVVAGRKTYESFPKRPLPGRRNIVLSRSRAAVEGAEVFDDINKLLDHLKTLEEPIFVIGGAEVYRELERYCGEALITRVYENFGGDSFFHDMEHDRAWTLAESSPVIETNGRRIRFMRYVRGE